MSEEEKELLARIGQIAGQINRHKNQQSGQPALSSHHPSHHRHNTYRRGQGAASQPAYRIRRHGPVHRHRTLILNSGTQTPSSADSDSNTAPEASSSWVSKTDRHPQLINTSVYEKETQTRTKAMEETRQQKLRQQDQHEKAKLLHHFNRQAGATNPGATNGNQAGSYEVDIQGIRFRVIRNGSKLVKLPGDLNPPSATPRVAVVGGVKFYRTKTGNLYRDGVLKAHRQAGAVKKVNEPCRAFSSTGNFLLSSTTANRAILATSPRQVWRMFDFTDHHCFFLGSCMKGPRCRYIHDATKVAVCKEFLLKESCGNGDACDLSHELTPQRTPTCLHYLKGHCSNPSCRYTHSNVSPGALVCRPFGLYGYCEKGAACEDRHVSECPDFSNTGTCKTKGCKLLHRERASVLRKSKARDDTDAPDEADDLSSDADTVHSDDVDSDEVEEFIGQGDYDDSDFKVQKDFIAFA